MYRPRETNVERFREAPWFPWSGWYWWVEGGASGIARTKAKAVEQVERELVRLGRFVRDGQVA